jgi:lipid A 3-O-deacylase
MTFPYRFYYSVAACLLAATAPGRAQGFKLESAGVRFGLNVGREFHQAEAFADWNLPWAWEVGDYWRVRTGLGVSSGWIGDSVLSAAIFTAGPLLVVEYRGFPLFLEGGSSPTVLTRSEFSRRDFGIPFQFTSYIGGGWNVARHWRLAYRFQHMSNAGLASSNPGLNLHVFALSYRF